MSPSARIFGFIEGNGLTSWGSATPVVYVTQCDIRVWLARAGRLPCEEYWEKEDVTEDFKFPGLLMLLLSH